LIYGGKEVVKGVISEGGCYEEEMVALPNDVTSCVDLESVQEKVDFLNQFFKKNCVKSRFVKKCKMIQATLDIRYPDYS
jgi:hypothetical protein